MTALGILILPEHTGREAARIWSGAEQLGFDHAWTPDHLSWRSLRDRPWFDAMTTLAAAACHTSTMVLGTLVTTPNFRHPVLTAKQAMALDRMSEGRFLLGVGAGAAGPDAVALGEAVPAPAQRAARFAEFVTLVDLLLRRRATTFGGRFYRADDVRMVPGCVQRPRLPLAVAATGPRGMRLAAHLADMWVTIGDPRAPGSEPEAEAFATLRRQTRRLTEVCDEAQRVQPLRRTVNLSRVVADPYASPERLADLVGRCAELGFTDVVLARPRAEGVFAGDPRAFERAVLHVRGLEDLMEQRRRA
ncbi:LLM class flavin-dependent oxidoreductase [Streptomyces spiramyceticus]|uniref:LLM class flavin-dependent oxidoreductase n=1 Tax=Streptomyces spiramyceticus TaxID=299717 RepID=UPI00237B6EB2|nr:LLM class flavin-dependent oxidoreductase [Streptomyces spiramyceticus]